MREGIILIAGDAVPEGGGCNKEGTLPQSHKMAMIWSTPTLLDHIGQAEAVKIKQSLRYLGPILFRTFNNQHLNYPQTPNGNQYSLHSYGDIKRHPL